ncbi:hypothetical protein BS78_K081400 [Paspalum vaginatum]|uniref:Uncharacterized protein n=1 Tax=Paspalum vaginatum TaxID=158149 RepID=A0A9W7XBZ7_9POAL|nr:hypothetical protein BS78_K081400 [Paspalum vaginatum]
MGRTDAPLAEQGRGEDSDAAYRRWRRSGSLQLPIWRRFTEERRQGRWIHASAFSLPDPCAGCGRGGRAWGRHGTPPGATRRAGVAPSGGDDGEGQRHARRRRPTGWAGVVPCMEEERRRGRGGEDVGARWSSTTTMLLLTNPTIVGLLLADLPRDGAVEGCRGGEGRQRGRAELGEHRGDGEAKLCRGRSRAGAQCGEPGPGQWRRLRAWRRRV